LLPGSSLAQDQTKYYTINAEMLVQCTVVPLSVTATVSNVIHNALQIDDSYGGYGGYGGGYGGYSSGGGYGMVEVTIDSGYGQYGPNGGRASRRGTLG